MSTPKSTLIFAPVLACAAIMFSSGMLASAQTWNVPGGGDWNNAANWTPGTVPNGVGATANITSDITANSNVTVNASITVGTLTIGDSNGTHAFTLNNSGNSSLTFDNTGTTDAQLNKIALVNTTISVPLILNDRLVVTNSNTAAGNSNVLILTGGISGAGGMTFSTEQPTGAAITGTGATSFTSSNLVLNAATSYLGSTVLAKGDLTINSLGTGSGIGLQGTSELVFQGGNIVVRNGDSGTDNNRINDAADFRVQSDGVFVYRTANAAYAASESVDKLILETGTFQYRVMSETTAGFNATFTFSDLERTGASNYSFANFGSGTTVLGNATTPGTNRLMFTNINGAAATDSSYLGGWATYGSFTNFAAYDTTRGIIAATQSNVAASSNNGTVNFLRNTGNITLNGGNKSMHTYAHGTSSITTSINGTLTLVGGGLTFGANPTGSAQAHNLTNGFIQVGNTSGADTLYLSVGAQSATTATISAVIQNNGSDVLTVAKGGPGQAIFNNAMTYTGATVVEGGTLSLGASGSIVNSAVVTRRNTTFDVSGISGSSASVGSIAGVGNLNLGNKTLISGSNNSSTTYSGVITGTGGALTKTGNGTLTLNGTLSYTGATTVNGGTLLLNTTLNGSAVTVASGGRLGGSGVISGSTTTIQSGGVHAPGNSPGVQTFSNDNLTYNTGSIYEWELFSNTALLANRGNSTIGFDGVDLTGTSLLSIQTGVTARLIFDGTTDFGAAFWTTDQSWMVFDAASLALTDLDSLAIFDSIQIVDNALGTAPGAGNFFFSQDNVTGDIFLNYTAIPEPSTYAMVLGGLAALVFLRRRAKKSNV